MARTARALELGGIPALRRVHGVEEASGKAAGEGAVKAPLAILVGDNLLLDRYGPLADGLALDNLLEVLAKGDMIT